MGDPTASFVLSARDTTAAGINSAVKSLKGIQSAVTQTRSLFRSFGVVLSARMFAHYISDLAEVGNRTDDWAKTIRAASDELGQFGDEVNNFVRVIMAKLAPAVTEASKFWRDVLFPSDQSTQLKKAESEYEAAIKEIVRLQDELANPGRKPASWLDFLNSNLATARGRAVELYSALEIARANFDRTKPVDANSLPLINMLHAGDRDYVTRDLDALGKIQKELRTLTGDALNAEGERMLAHGNTLGAIKSLSEAARVSASEEIRKWQEVARNTPEFAQEAAEGIALVNRNLGIELKGIAEESSKDFRDAFGRGLHDSFVDVLLGMEVNFKDFLKRMVTELIASSLFKTLGSMFVGGTGFSGFLAGLFGGARAAGGPVSAGKSYLVGERGPELFTPGSGGMISASGGGGSINLTQYNDFRGVDPSAAARIGSMLERNKRETIAAVRDLKNRNRL